jgi:hypothetical protein
MGLTSVLKKISLPFFVTSIILNALIGFADRFSENKIQARKECENKELVRSVTDSLALAADKLSNIMLGSKFAPTFGINHVDGAFYVRNSDSSEPMYEVEVRVYDYGKILNLEHVIQGSNIIFPPNSLKEILVSIDNLNIIPAGQDHAINHKIMLEENGLLEIVMKTRRTTYVQRMYYEKFSNKDMSNFLTISQVFKKTKEGYEFLYPMTAEYNRQKYSQINWDNLFRFGEMNYTKVQLNKILLKDGKNHIPTKTKWETL